MEFTIVNQQIVHNSTEVNVADTLNCLSAVFEFDTSWDALSKTAHFANGDVSYSFPLIEDGITNDRGLNLTEGVWGVSVSGVMNIEVGVLRKTSNIYYMRVLPSGFTEGSPFPVIDPDIIEVIQADILELQTMLSVPGVPDTIAVRDVNGSIYTNTIKLGLTPAGVPVPGEIYWDADSMTAAIQTLYGVSLQVNQESTIPGRNNTGVQINDGTVCYWQSAIGLSGKFRIAPFIANGSIESERVLGIATHNIVTGTVGLMTSMGIVRGIDTTGVGSGETWAAGDVLYASPTQAGKMTKVKPSSPNRIVRIGAILTAHAQNGIMFVRPTIYPANASTTTDGLMSAADKAKLNSL